MAEVSAPDIEAQTNLALTRPGAIGALSGPLHGGAPSRALDLLDEIRGDTALLLITHDLGIVAGRCERMLVIDAGRVVETDRTAGLFKAPRTPLTRSLLADALTLSEEPPPPGDGDILVPEQGQAEGRDRRRAFCAGRSGAGRV